MKLVTVYRESMYTVQRRNNWNLGQRI